MQASQTTDFLVIGGGIIGICLALEAKRRHPQSQVTLIEKEKELGFHASGRNSGVLHAGFYYTADSLKARFTREGNSRLRAYCEEKKLGINDCGKLVVAMDAFDLPGLEELKRRADANQVELHEISEREAQEIEPRAKTFQKALFSPRTATVNPLEIMESLEKDALSAGIDIHKSTIYISRRNKDILTSSGTYSAGYVINASGLYADKIARNFGFSNDYRILPFKGIYLYGEATERLRTNIYPVPNLNNPFLGVHFTLTVDNKVKIGPTAIPAFWREHYRGLQNFSWREFAEIVAREASLFVTNSLGFRKLAITEIQKYYQPRLVKLAAKLVTNIQRKAYRHWGKPGIRAQLYNLKENKLEMDFKFEGDKDSFHVLNAVSPAFTCSLPFCEYLFDEIEALQRH